MKNLLFILLFCAQSVAAQTGIVNGWNYIVALPQDYNSTTINYPAIVFFPGRGEVGNNVNALRNNGPHAFIEQGGTIPGFIVISLQPQLEFPSEAAMDSRLTLLKGLYRIDTSRVNLTGLSHGGWCAATYAAIYPAKVFSIITVQGMIPDDNSPYPQVYSNWKGKHICFEQSQDGRGGLQLVNYINSLRPNQAQFILTNYNGGSHCCFNNYYGGQGVQPAAFNLNGKQQNIYQYLTEINGYNVLSLPTVRNFRTVQIASFRQNGNTIYFKASMYDSYSIVSLLGQTVQVGRYKAGVNEIQLKPISSGIYFFKSLFANHTIIKL